MIVWDSKGLGQLAAQAERALGSGPDRKLIIVPLRDCRTRFQRRMSDVSDSIGLVQPEVRRLEALFDRPGSMSSFITSTLLFAGIGLFQALEQLMIGNLRNRLPL